MRVDHTTAFPNGFEAMGDEAADGQRADTPEEPRSSSPPAVYTGSPGSRTAIGDVVLRDGLEA